MREKLTVDLLHFMVSVHQDLFNAFTQHHPRHAIDAPKVPEKEVQSELVRQATLILRRDKEQRQAMKAVATRKGVKSRNQQN